MPTPWTPNSIHIPFTRAHACRGHPSARTKPTRATLPRSCDGVDTNRPAHRRNPKRGSAITSSGAGGRRGPPDTGKGARRMEGFVLREGSEATRIRSRTQGLRRPFAIPEFMSIARNISEIENSGESLRSDPNTLANPRVSQTLRNPRIHVVETTHRENRNQGRYEESVPANWRPQGGALASPRRFFLLFPSFHCCALTTNKFQTKKFLY